MSRMTLLFVLVVCISCATPVSEVAEGVTEPAITSTEVRIAATAAPTRTPRPTWTTIPTNTPQPDTPIAATVAPATDVPTLKLAPTETQNATATIEPTLDVGASSADPSVTPIQPTAPPPATATVVPPTAAPIAITATTVPATAIPATETNVPPTATRLPPTPTAIPTTPTPIPPTAVPTSSALSIGSLASLPDGQEVTITGNVVNASSFSAGFKFTIADSTGRISMVLFGNTYDDCWDKNVLNVGATVVVTGKVGRFEGELQVVPQWGGGVDVTAPAYAYAQPQTVANLRSVIGQRAMITGELTRVDVAEQFTKLYLNDGTGEVEVFLWNNIWERVPNKDSLAAGQQIKAVGIVGEFRGTLQLSPPLPYDIVR